jgi:hypothetical protein
MSPPRLRYKTLSQPATLLLESVVLLWAPFAIAQTNLGELLDAGAKKLSVDEFKEEIVQRVLVGPAPSGGGKLELMYATNGEIQGLGTYPPVLNSPQPFRGGWTTDASGRVCSAIQFAIGNPPVSLPTRCQFWFKYDGQYFFADSDSERSARVVPRTLKQ